MRSKKVIGLLLMISAVLSAIIACKMQEVSPSSAITSAISDSAHNSGNEHFYFLPPLVPSPSYSGIFDGTLSPVVVICIWTGTECSTEITQYSTQTGPGSETIRVDPIEQYYIVNWHTDQFSLDPSKTYRIRVLVDEIELGYADVDVVKNGSELKNVNTNEYIPLKDGRTLPIKFRIEKGANNRPPVATDDSAVTIEDASISIAVLNNDVDPDSDSIHVVSVTSPSHGNASINSDQSITYAPHPNYNGTDSFTYTITDGKSTDTAEVTISIAPVNDPPNAEDDSITTEQAKAVAIAVLANDTDLDGDSLSVISCTEPIHGTVGINLDGTITYTPFAIFWGQDSFVYTISDNHGGTDTATVVIEVIASVSYRKPKEEVGGSGEPIEDLWYSDGNPDGSGYFDVSPEQVMHIVEFDIDGLPDSTTISGAKLIIRYTTSSLYDAMDSVLWRKADGAYQTAFIVTTCDSTVEKIVDLTDITTLGHVRTLDVKFTNGDYGANRFVRFDYMAVIVEGINFPW